MQSTSITILYLRHVYIYGQCPKPEFIALITIKATVERAWRLRGQECLCDDQKGRWQGYEVWTESEGKRLERRNAPVSENTLCK